MSGIIKHLFYRKKAEGYPGKGIFSKPKPVRRASVNSELCRGCGDCCAACYYGKIVIDRTGKAHVKRGCSGCGACRSACSSDAIVMIENN